MKRWEKITLIFFIIGFLLVLIIAFLGGYELVEGKFFDLFVKIRAKELPFKELILIEIEEEIKEEGLWPWRNEWLVYLINYLSGTGAKAILVDSSVEKYIIPEHYLLKTSQAKTNILFPKKDSLETHNKDLIVDKDSKVRRYNLFDKDKESLIFQLYSSYKKIDEKRYSPKFLINYERWKIQDIRRYSYFDVVISIFLASRKEVPKVDFSEFKDKLCIIGLSPSLSNKLYPTPLGLLSPLEIRLQSLNSLLKGNFLKRINRGISLILALVVFFLSSFLFLKFFRFKRALFLSISISFYLIISFLLFSYLKIWMDNFLPALSMIYAFFAVSIYVYGQERIIRIEKRRRELAKKLKGEILTNNSLVLDNLEIVVKMFFSHEVKGDFFDIIKLAENRFGILIGEAPGENLETVNYIIKLINEFRLQASLHKRPRAVLNAINNILFAEGIRGMYATCLYLIIDLDNHILSFANSGHEPLLLASREVQEINQCEALDATPLGIARNVVFLDQDLSINEGDLIIGFTSGLFKIKNKEGKEFGINNLKEVINQYRNWSVSKLANKIFEKIHRFCQGQEINNESTILLIKIKEKKLEDGRKKIFVQQAGQ